MAEATTDIALTVTLPGDTKLLITRELDAPRHLVYRAWTTPELVRPAGAAARHDDRRGDRSARVGGAWRYVVEAQGGFEVAFHGEFREIVENEPIVMTEIYEAEPGDAAGADEGRGAGCGPNLT